MNLGRKDLILWLFSAFKMEIGYFFSGLPTSLLDRKHLRKTKGKRGGLNDSVWSISCWTQQRVFLKMTFDYLFLLRINAFSSL